MCQPLPRLWDYSNEVDNSSEKKQMGGYIYHEEIKMVM